MLTRAQQDLAAQNMDLARSIGAQVARDAPSQYREDIMSAAMEGLVQAAARYSPDVEDAAPFRAYAAHRVRGACIDDLRRQQGRHYQRPRLQALPEHLDNVELVTIDTTAPDPADVVVRAEVVEAAYQAIDEVLDDTYADTFKRVVLEEQRSMDVAANDGVTAARISQRNLKMRQRVRDRLRELDMDDAAPLPEPTKPKPKPKPKPKIVAPPKVIAEAPKPKPKPKPVTRKTHAGASPFGRATTPLPRRSPTATTGCACGPQCCALPKVLEVLAEHGADMDRVASIVAT